MPAYNGPVFISYAHDPEGRKLAAALVDVLRKAGIEVIWDVDFPAMNPASLHELIAGYISKHPVIMVCSPKYAHRFGNGDDSPEHATVVYEGRLLMNKYKNHTVNGGCPLIPVSSRLFAAKDFLSNIFLTSPIISKLDPETGEGANQIIERVRALPPAPATVGTPSTDAGSPRSLRDVMCDVEEVSPAAPNAMGLVQEWLEFARQPSDNLTPFAQSFPHVERIIKAKGDVPMMVVVVDMCLAALSGERSLNADRQLKARILICGRAWYLRRKHHYEEALSTAREGLKLAEKCGEDKVRAFGKRCLARIHRCLAEETDGEERKVHLRDATRLAEEALTIFESIEVIEPHTGGVAVCRLVLANIHFTEYRLLRRPIALWRACTQAKKATGPLPPDRAREHSELLILRARIAAAQWRRAHAKTLIAKAIAALSERSLHGASYSELLGRARLVSAELQGAVSEVDEAERIFHELKQPCAIAACAWLRLTLTRETKELTRRDVVLIERECADPAERLQAVEEHEKWQDERAGARWYRRRRYWRRVVRRLRARSD